MAHKKRVVLNVSGEIFETLETTLSRFPKTVLGNSAERGYFYCSQTNQYFFNRSRTCFGAILYFYQSNGTLLCPTGTQIPIFEEECRYFKIGDDAILGMKRREGIILDEPNVEHGRLTWKKRIWNVLEYPHTSRIAWLFGVWSLAMVFLSLIISLVETIPGYINDRSFHMVDDVVFVWFSIELTARLVFCENKNQFFQEPMNWVDILSVLPFIAVEIFYHDNEQVGILGIFKTLKFMRVLRLFRLSRHSKRLRIIFLILTSSLGDFKLLVVCFVIVTFLAGTLIHFTECAVGTPGFTSIPQGIWWAVQTMTSVGYGDLVPHSIFGRVFACCCMIFGVLTVSLPVLSIVANFANLYPKNMECDAYIRECKTFERQNNSLRRKNSKMKIVRGIEKSNVKILM